VYCRGDLVLFCIFAELCVVFVVVVDSILVTKLRHTAADACRQLHCHWRTYFSSPASLTLSVATVIQRDAESRLVGHSSVKWLAFGSGRVTVPNTVTCVGLSVV
jgi:hypothetical protein